MALASSIPPSTTPSSALFASNTVSQVRQYEIQLRGEVVAHRDKIRALVGGRYRDLLQTAETIVQMDREMITLDATFRSIGQRCSQHGLDQRKKAHGSLDPSIEEQTIKYMIPSQISLLKACSEVIYHTLLAGKEGGQHSQSFTAETLLTSAKILVIARLLHSKLAKSLTGANAMLDQPDLRPYLEKLRMRLAKVRRLLLRQIDRKLVSTRLDFASKVIDLDSTSSQQKSPKTSVLQILCAFALATSSSCTEVMRHFYQVRLEHIRRLMSIQDGGKVDGPVKSLRLYIRTMREGDRIAPVQISNALKSLKNVALLQSDDVQQLLKFKIDTRERWVGDEIRVFLPYIRHDDLTEEGTEKIMRSWAADAIKCYLDTLRVWVKSMLSASKLIAVRNDCLALWLSSSNRRHENYSFASTLDSLRAIFNDQITHLIQRSSHKLDKFEQLLHHTFDNWKTEAEKPISLWSQSTVSFEASKAGDAFRQEIINVTAGKTGVMRKICTRYDSWRNEIEKMETLINSLRDFSRNDASDDESDDELATANSRTIDLQLSKHDPDILQQALHKACHSNVLSLEQCVAKLAQDLDSSHKAAFLLRICCRLTSSQPSAAQNKLLCDGTAAATLAVLATEIIKAPMHTYIYKHQKNLSRKNPKSFKLKQLWEGSPSPLPIFPSPSTYRLLIEVNASLASYGSDLWTPSAIDPIQQRFFTDLSTFYTKQDFAIRGDHSRDALIQELFDIMYLGHLRSMPLWRELQERVVSALAVSEEEVVRMQGAAKEYWARTSLMFGLIGGVDL